MEMDVADHGPGDRRLIVGIDLGTTFSGVAFQPQYRPDQRVSEAEVRTVRSWPSVNGPSQDESKVPSRVLYDAQGQVKAWGYCNPDGDNSISMGWFKLALVPEKHLPPRVQGSEKLRQTKESMHLLGVNAVQVTAQYLEKIWRHGLGEIEKIVGRRDFESMPIHVVITIPAIWGKYWQAIEMMKEAAAFSILQPRPAGLTTYEFLYEPEAAIQAYAKELQLKLNVGETVMFLDLGGGTGDTGSYEIMGKNDGTSLKLKEACPGDGDLCGAIFVDEAFETLLENKLPAKHRHLKTQNPDAWERILSHQWHRIIKPTFEYQGNNHFWSVYLSDIGAPGDVVRLHEDEIRNAFEDTVMPKILDLARRQIRDLKKVHNTAPRIILTVGGFGRCPYVLQRLRQEFEGRDVAPQSVKKGGRKKQKVNPEPIEILSEQGDMPWTAVCKGACLHGMRAKQNNPLVKSRSSRVSLGFILNEPGLKENGAIWIDDFQELMIPNAMRWVVRKGDSISTDKKSTMPMVFAFDNTKKGRHTESAKFYAYDGESPPDLFDESNPKFEEYGVMTITLPKKIEQLQLQSATIDERREYHYNLQVEIVNGSIEITAISTSPVDHGKEIGKLVLSKLEPT